MRILGSLLVLAAAAGCRPPGYGQGDDDASPDASATADGAPGAPDGAPPLDAEPVFCDASFRLEGHGAASTVWLSGDFLGWAGQPADGAIPLVLGIDTAWTATHHFAAGTYQYKFIVDGGEWIADPANPTTVDDLHGGLNSLYVCD